MFEPIVISKRALCLYISPTHLIANIVLKLEWEAALTYTAARQTLPSVCQLSIFLWNQQYVLWSANVLSQLFFFLLALLTVRFVQYCHTPKVIVQNIFAQLNFKNRKLSQIIYADTAYLLAIVPWIKDNYKLKKLINSRWNLLPQLFFVYSHTSICNENKHHNKVT